MNIISPLKIQGKKTKICTEIARISSSKLNDGFIWVEPFLGSGQVLFYVNPNKAIVSDNNPHIINFFRDIQSGKLDSNIIRCFLEKHGEKLKLYGKKYYYKMRNEFNKNHSSLYFLFLNRSCFNGLLRFNSKGEFNVPFCNKSNRFSKSYITKIVNQVKTVQKIIQSHGKNWVFKCCNWESILNSKKKYLYYFDPPYIQRNATYLNAWLEEENILLFNKIIQLEQPFILSNWENNKYRKNKNLNIFLAKKYKKITTKHFYHVGGKINNRHAINECLIFNF